MLLITLLYALPPVLQNEGMPIHGRPFEKGNLYVHFTGWFKRAVLPWQRPTSTASCRAAVVHHNGSGICRPCARACIWLACPFALLTLPSSVLRCSLPAAAAAAVEFPDQVTSQQAAALTAAFGKPSTANGAAPMGEVSGWGSLGRWGAVGDAVRDAVKSPLKPAGTQVRGWLIDST